MKIAVTYENENVFQHFGHAENFKVYEVENDKVVSSEVVKANASGHDAMVKMLDGLGVDALICGGIGDGAIAALDEAGIEVCSGVSGNADEAVDAYLNDELISEGINCNRHRSAAEEDMNDESGCGCGCGCGSDDGGCGCGDDEAGCGGCGDGCGGCGCGFVPDFDGPNVGKACSVHYRGTYNDGTQFDASYDRGETLDFVCGAGMMIKGFDKAVATMEVGQTVNIHLEPSEAYGEKDPNAIFEVEIAELPGAEELEVGEQVYLYNQFGQPFQVKVMEKDDKNIKFDANHEMAGKELNFEITLVSVE